MAKCPAHNDHNPSLSIRELNDRILLHCFAGCGVEQVLESIGLKISDLFARELSRSSVRPPRWRTGRWTSKVAEWLNDQHLKCAILLRELSRQMATAEKIPDLELVTDLAREWEILSDLFFDLQDPRFAREFLEWKEGVENITRWAEPDSLPEFPKLTEEYRSFLAEVVRRC